MEELIKISYEQVPPSLSDESDGFLEDLRAGDMAPTLFSSKGVVV